MFVWEDNDMPYSRIKINATNITIWEKLKKRNTNLEKKRKQFFFKQLNLENAKIWMQFVYGLAVEFIKACEEYICVWQSSYCSWIQKES